jgi:hypothetical protein
VLKEHLAKWHSGVNPDAELEEIKRNSRSTTTSTRKLPQNSSSTPELERCGRAEFQLHPPTLLSSAMTGLPSVSLPASLPVAYRPHFEFAEPTFSLIKKRSQMAQDLDVYARSVHALSIRDQ